MEDGPPGPSSDRTGSLVDQHVGARLRQRRTGAGLSVATIAQTLGVSAGDIRAWESGSRRIPASYLLVVSTLLSCPLAEFFEGLPTDAKSGDDIETSEYGVLHLFNQYSDAKH